MNEHKVLSYPWTWRGPDEVTVDGVPHYRMTIEELPGFEIIERDPCDVVSRLLSALQEFLETHPDLVPGPLARSTE